MKIGEFLAVPALTAIVIHGSNYRITNSGKGSSYYALLQWDGVELGLDEAPALHCWKKVITGWVVYLFHS